MQNLRFFIAEKVFRWRRFFYWFKKRNTFAKEIKKEKLEYIIFRHRTPMLRKLKDVDMQWQYNKAENLKIATGRLNGIVMKPGEVFSYWKMLGEPKEKEGYKEGMVLKRDGTFEGGIGGGLCQLSNLIYWMTINSPLTITERWRHMWDVFPDAGRTQPFGSGATCFYNYMDLQIRNDMEQEFQFIFNIDEEFLNGEIRSEKPWDVSYEVIEEDHEMCQELNGRYSRHNKIFRNVIDKKTGETIRKEFITENHVLMMYSPMISSKK